MIERLIPRVEFPLCSYRLSILSLALMTGLILGCNRDPDSTAPDSSAPDSSATVVGKSGQSSEENPPDGTGNVQSPSELNQQISKKNAPEKGESLLKMLVEGKKHVDTNEDPEVHAYFKKKGWTLFRDWRISDGKALVYLTPEDRDSPFQDITLTEEDYKMIARSKTAQVVNLNSVKVSDEGLEILSKMETLEGIIVSGESVTDTGMKHLANLKSLVDVNLTLATKVTDEGMKELAALPKLSSLHCMGFGLTGSCFEAFADKESLRSISLVMMDGLTDAGVKNFTKLPNLVHLEISTGYVFGKPTLTADGIRTIVNERMPTFFEFPEKLIADDELFIALVKNGWLYGPAPSDFKGEEKPASAADLTSLDLGKANITDVGFGALSDCVNLELLILNCPKVTDEGLKLAEKLKELNYLSLGKTNCTATGLQYFAHLPIKHLAIEGAELTEDHFKVMGKFEGLEELWLNDSKFDPAWLKHLTTLSKLTELSLRNAAFNDDAVQYVEKLPALKKITLNNTELGDPGFQQLLKKMSLKQLYVDSTKVTREVYRKAKAAHPNLSLYFYRHDQDK